LKRFSIFFYIKPNYYAYDCDETDITIDWDLEVGYKRMQELNSPSDKALYLIMSILEDYYECNRDEIDELHEKSDPDYYDVNYYSEDTTNSLVHLIVSECYRNSSDFQVLLGVLKPQNGIDEFIEEIKQNYNPSNFEQDLAGTRLEIWKSEYDYMELEQFYKNMVFGESKIVCYGD
jgi:hypothetical protein